MSRTIAFLKHNLIAVIALFVALGGTSYAAVAIPKASVGSAQLRKGAVTAGKIKTGAVTPGKLASGSFGGRIADFVVIANNGSVVESTTKGVKVENWTLDSNGGVVMFPHRIHKGCYPIANPVTANGLLQDQPPTVAAEGGNGTAEVSVVVSSEASVSLAVICGH